jgi:hypothetical protein
LTQPRSRAARYISAHRSSERDSALRDSELNPFDGQTNPLLLSFLTVAVLSGVFLAEAIAAFPPNDRHPRKSRVVD